MKSFAFVFPGQGSQAVGMLNAWGDHPAVRQTLSEASDALGEDVGQLIKESSKETLALTTNTQPIMLVAGVAAYRVWMTDIGMPPAVVAGHSLGEYAALVASGVLSLSQAAPLVRFRAQAMQDAVPIGTGAMAAILGMEAVKVIEGCQQAVQTFGPETLEVVEAVNFNEPMQTVVAGSNAAVTRACEILKANGAKRILPLPVSAPFHSSLMKPAADRLMERLLATDFAAPRIPVINNVDAMVESSPDRIRSALYRQSFGAVRWVECVQAIKSRGVTDLIECGPGKILTGMVKRIDPQLTGACLFDPASLLAVKDLLV